MKKYILLSLLSLGLFAFVPGQAKADDDFSIGPVTIYRHHSPEWYRERERLRRQEMRNVNGENINGENVTGASILMNTKERREP